MKIKVVGHLPIISGLLRKQEMSSLSTVATNDCSLFREYVQADAFRETDLKHMLGWLSLLQPAEIFRTQDWEL